MNEQLTFATVAFEAELTLLELQARSFAQHMDPDCIAHIFVLDNTAAGLGKRSIQRLRRNYGGFFRRLTIVRVNSLTSLRGVGGWRSQQIAKLAISRHVHTPHYVVLDAKNHLIRAANYSTFMNADGRAHIGLHSYRDHPLRDSLATTISFLGGTAADVASCQDSFPITATPFIFDTAMVKRCMSYVQTSTDQPFEVAFEAAKLLEFFTYAGWIMLHGPGFDAVLDRIPIQSPTVWPKGGNAEGLANTIRQATNLDSPFFAVHRKVLAHADKALQEALADWWKSRGLVDSRAEGVSLLRRFQRGYTPGMVTARVNERLERLRVKILG